MRSERLKRPQEESAENTLTSADPRPSTRQQKPDSFGPDFLALFLEGEPQIFKAFMSLSDSTYWKEVVNSEIDSILSNHT